MCQNIIVEEQFQRLDQFIDNSQNTEGNLIAVLHKAQEIFGYLPEEVQWHIAQKLDIPSSKVYGVVSFYSFFTTKPRGKHVVNVCMGTACFVRGGERIFQAVKKELNTDIGETTEDGLFSLDALRCVGACGMAPVMIVDGKVYGRIKAPQVRAILQKYRREEEM